MLTDERNYIRKLAFRRILVGREENRHSLRRFRVSKLNFEADDDTNLIGWIYDQKSELLAYISTYEIRSLVNGVTLIEPVLNISQFPCHTQLKDTLSLPLKHRLLFAVLIAKME